MVHRIGFDIDNVVLAWRSMVTVQPIAALIEPPDSVVTGPPHRRLSQYSARKQLLCQVHELVSEH